MSTTKNDALEPNSKLNRREYERELARRHVAVASHMFP
jgi:hypothetical protein